MVILLLSLMPITAFSADPSMLPTKAGSVLRDGTYIVNKNISIEAPSSSKMSGLEIAPGATVILEFRNNARLEVRGDNSGAGIHVPESSTLYITGTGTLIATGGIASNGADGQAGNDGKSYAELSTDMAYGGKGGNGGAGGNGAGAGIGGRGGKGGYGGVGGSEVITNNGEPDDGLSGNNGNDGMNGADGETMGTVILVGDGVAVDAKGGMAGLDGSNGIAGSCSRYMPKAFQDGSIGGGGGAGAGGCGGGAAASIGGGGYGGAGGGAGGSGAALSDRLQIDEGTWQTGTGGGYTEGNLLVAPGSIKFDQKEVKGGYAGRNGGNGKMGGNGIYKIHHHNFDEKWSYNQTAHWHTCKEEYCCYQDDYSGSAEASYGLHTGMENGFCSVCGMSASPAAYTVTFDMNGHGTAPDNQTVREGGKASVPDPDPAAEGWTFVGWYADANFDTVFDFNTAIVADTTIYAKWTMDSFYPGNMPTPPTGDNSNVFLWIALLFVSGGILTGAMAHRQKK